MAQILLVNSITTCERCLARGTYASIGDVVDVYEDDVDLSSDGYAQYKIVRFPGTAKEVKDKLQALIPEHKTAYRLSADKGIFTFDEPEQIDVWNDNGIYRKIETKSMYGLNVAVDAALEAELKDDALTTETKTTALTAKTVINVAAKADNQVEIADLTVKVEEIKP